MQPKSKLRALFVEDSETDVELILLELKREGFEVQWERVDSETCLKLKLDSGEFDIVLSDYSMPGFDGSTALKMVREFVPDVPFIFVSGTIGEERAIESIWQGATDYVLKGNLRRLGTAVRRALVEVEERRHARVTEEARSRLAAIMEATSDYVAIYDPALRVTYVNAAGRRLLGLREEEEADGRPLDDFHPRWAYDLIKDEAEPEVVDKGIWQGETALLNRDGEEIPISQVIIAHRDSQGGLSYLSTIGRDIRERKAFEKQISYLANYDGLTDLPNRNLLRDRVLQTTVYARRSRSEIALLVVNVDRFKLVNDALGHETGDVLLQILGERLRGIVHEGDTVARLAADGFAILITDLRRADDVLMLARKLHEEVQEPFILKGKETYITLSVGASIFPRDGEDFESLLRNAEAAMHRVQAQGRGGFEYYTAEMTREAEDHVDLETALRHALTHDELQLHYQPQVRIESGELIGLEALMRWHREGHGWVSPGQFIPVAEDSDLILALDEFALSTACRQLGDWNGGFGANSLRMSVNISARQFRSRGFVETVGEVLRATGIEPPQLELELTENVLIEAEEQVMQTLRQLKDLGVRISVDDFGTGYSSLSYLSRLPIDCLKIDQSFVRSLSVGSYNAHIVQAVISLAHALQMNVIAEGIETEEQLAFLREHGCDEGQGYLFSKALDAKTIMPIIKSRSTNDR